MDALAVSAVTDAVDFSSVITGIGAVAAGVALLLITKRGASALLGTIGGR